MTLQVLGSSLGGLLLDSKLAHPVIPHILATPIHQGDGGGVALVQGLGQCQQLLALDVGLRDNQVGGLGLSAEVKIYIVYKCILATTRASYSRVGCPWCASSQSHGTAHGALGVVWGCSSMLPGRTHSSDLPSFRVYASYAGSIFAGYFTAFLMQAS